MGSDWSMGENFNGECQVGGGNFNWECQVVGGNRKCLKS